MFTLLPLPVCPRCQEPIEERASRVECEGCLAPHHEHCWHRAGGCASLQARPKERAPAERPPRVRRIAEGRRRELLDSLTRHEEEEHEPSEERPRRRRVGFDVTTDWTHRVGERLECVTCSAPYVMLKDYELRCPSCVRKHYVKLGLTIVVVIAMLGWCLS